ncbi:MAG TPA: DUF4386 family protein [Casimicrobiaceae bacterium]|nr:DUF4386 family protein [Casimicrobiaceae bacterium]HXU67206.1 DUF4386 family protein [Casimicrobiaceae bacterium]
MQGQHVVEIDRKVPLALFAFVAGALSLLLLVVSVLTPPPATPAELLAFASTHRLAYGLFASLVLAWAVLSVPLIVTLGTMLRSQGGTLTGVAQLLSAGGVLLLGFAVFANTAALLSIVAAGNAPHPEDPIYLAAIWINLSFYLTDPGLMTWGLGQFLFGWIAWRSEVLPNWLAVIGIIGGLAGLSTLAVFQTPVLALVQLLSFTIWGFVTGSSLLRSRRSILATA